MGPGQLATQCVAFPGIGEGEVELPEILEVGDGDAVAEFLAERACKVPDEVLAIVGAVFSSLFLLDDAAADVPIGLNHDEVRSDIGFLPGLLENRPHLFKKTGPQRSRIGDG